MQDKIDTFLSQLRPTLADLSYFVDFEKVCKRTSAVEIHLNTLNYLLGKDDLDAAVQNLWSTNKEAFQVCDILIATRENKQSMYLDQFDRPMYVRELFSSCDGVIRFLHETGLAHVFKDRRIKSLVDYVFGVEVGMDTNARKNRSGALMERTVRLLMEKSGVFFRSQVKSSTLPEVHKVLNGDGRKFDFVVETHAKTYLIEVNFYSASGTKPDTIVRSYPELASKINKLDRYEFVWITDGTGWIKSKEILSSYFQTIGSIYNLTTIENLISKLQAENARIFLPLYK